MQLGGESGRDLRGSSLGRRTIPVCLGLRDFPGCEVLSSKSEEVLSKLTYTGHPGSHTERGDPLLQAFSSRSPHSFHPAGVLSRFLWPELQGVWCLAAHSSLSTIARCVSGGHPWQACEAQGPQRGGGLGGSQGLSTPCHWGSLPPVAPGL